MNRRTFLTQTALLAGAASAAPLLTSCQTGGAAATIGVEPLRLAHITDTHVFEKSRCPENMARFLAAFSALTKPDLILHTGDVIMDAMAKMDRAAAMAQWDLWHRLAKDLPAPTRYLLGNHDHWTGEEKGDPLFGKRLVMEQCQLEKPYYRFDQGGWVFLMLDSVSLKGEQTKASYLGKLDDAQKEWLTGQMTSIPSTTPVIVCSHIPLLSAAVHDWSNVRENLPDMLGKGRSAPGWVAWAPLMHVDSHEVQAILRKRIGVTLCLSGHLHLKDHVEYDNIHYLGNGAVCANWWGKPVFHQTKAGFATLELYPDGKWERKYHSYEWGA